MQQDSEALTCSDEEVNAAWWMKFNYYLPCRWITDTLNGWCIQRTRRYAWKQRKDRELMTGRDLTANMTTTLTHRHSTTMLQLFTHTCNSELMTMWLLPLTMHDPALTADHWPCMSQHWLLTTDHAWPMTTDRWPCVTQHWQLLSIVYSWRPCYSTTTTAPQPPPPLP